MDKEKVIDFILRLKKMRHEVVGLGLGEAIDGLEDSLGELVDGLYPNVFDEDFLKEKFL